MEGSADDVVFVVGIRETGGKAELVVVGTGSGGKLMLLEFDSSPVSEGCTGPGICSVTGGLTSLLSSWTCFILLKPSFRSLEGADEESPSDPGAAIKRKKEKF